MGIDFLGFSSDEMQVPFDFCTCLGNGGDGACCIGDFPMEEEKAREIGSEFVGRLLVNVKEGREREGEFAEKILKEAILMFTGPPFVVKQISLETLVSE